MLSLLVNDSQEVPATQSLVAKDHKLSLGLVKWKGKIRMRLR
jgi:hypothetical protein